MIFSYESENDEKLIHSSHVRKYAEKKKHDKICRNHTLLMALDFIIITSMVNLTVLSDSWICVWWFNKTAWKIIVLVFFFPSLVISFHLSFCPSAKIILHSYTFTIWREKKNICINISRGIVSFGFFSNDLSTSKSKWKRLVWRIQRVHT